MGLDRGVLGGTIRVLLAGLLAAAALVGCSGAAVDETPQDAPAGGEAPTGASALPGASGDARLAQAHAEHKSYLQVEGEGTVIRVLRDDLEGDRHQRFILRLASGQTLLVAHNVDLAPRTPDLVVGDPVAFFGVYEWSEEGGTVHWTHLDPGGEHVAGWLWHDGRTYQ